MSQLITLGQSAFERTWENSIYATWLIMLVIALQKVLARWLTPGLRYILSLLVLIRLLLPITPASVLSIENQFPEAARLTNQAAALPAADPSKATGIVIQQSAVSTPPEPATSPLHLSLAGAAGGVWAAGGLGLLLLAGWRLVKWHRIMRKGRQLADPSRLALLASAKEAMGVSRPVELVAIAGLSSPAIFGLLRVRLLLPETALRRLNDAELRMIFLHEMAHVRRKDSALNYLLMAVQYLHWFNPFVWLAFHRLRADRELVCDAMVMQRVRPDERLGYGNVLLKLMEDYSAGNPVFSGAVPVMSSLKEIKRRILMIKHHRPASLAACAVTALVVVALAFGVFTHAPRQKKQDHPAHPAPGMVEFENGGPRYHGQALGSWIFKLKQGNLQEQAEAREALQAVGKVAVPFLIESFERTNFPPQCRGYAASALGEIGPPASAAIPALLGLTCPASTAALMKIKGEPITGLVRALDEPVSDQWVTTAQTLAEFGTKASPAIPGLCRALHSEKGWAAAYAIGFIHSQPEIAIPALLDAVKLGSPQTVVNAIWALGAFETDASSAIPILRKFLEVPNPSTIPMSRQAALLSLHKILPPGEFDTLVPALIQNVNDPDQSVRMVARRMLKEIDPAAARKAGVVD